MMPKAGLRSTAKGNPPINTEGGKMKRPEVDREVCIGCGTCVGICPEVFELRDDKSWVIAPDKCNTCNCQEAVDSCPVEAIRLVEE